MKQFTKEQAITFANEKLYENMTDEQISIFQLDQQFLCMPFDVFVRAISKVLGRSVYTHEFAKPEALKREMYGSARKGHLLSVWATLIRLPRRSQIAQDDTGCK
jgi:hypothetical protein